MPKATNLKNKTILVTGANGFVGTVLCETIKRQGYIVNEAVRKTDKTLSTQQIAIGEINADTDWTSALSGVDTVIHLAARVHVMHDTASDALTAYRKVNVEGTLQLAKSAVKAGVKRFIFNKMDLSIFKTDHPLALQYQNEGVNAFYCSM